MVCERSRIAFSCECTRMVLRQIPLVWGLLVFHPPCGQRAFLLDMDMSLTWSVLPTHPSALLQHLLWKQSSPACTVDDFGRLFEVIKATFNTV